MYSYALAPCADSRDNMWRPIQSAVKHITIAGDQAIASARAHNVLHPRITEAEMAVRHEWHAIARPDPNIPYPPSSNWRASSIDLANSV